MKLLLLSFLVLTACTFVSNRPKHNVVYSNAHTDSYTTAILAKCKHESDLLAFMTAQGMMAREEQITEDDVTYLRKMLMDSCLKHYRLFI